MQLPLFVISFPRMDGDGHRGTSSGSQYMAWNAQPSSWPCGWTKGDHTSRTEVQGMVRETGLVGITSTDKIELATA